MKIKKQRDAKEGRKKDKEQNTKIRAKKLNKMMKKKKIIIVEKCYTWIGSYTYLLSVPLLCKWHEQVLTSVAD